MLGFSEKKINSISISDMYKSNKFTTEQLLPKVVFEREFGNFLRAVFAYINDFLD